MNWPKMASRTSAITKHPKQQEKAAEEEKHPYLYKGTFQKYYAQHLYLILRGHNLVV